MMIKTYQGRWLLAAFVVSAAVTLLVIFEIGAAQQPVTVVPDAPTDWCQLTQQQDAQTLATELNSDAYAQAFHQVYYDCPENLPVLNQAEQIWLNGDH